MHAKGNVHVDGWNVINYEPALIQGNIRIAFGAEIDIVIKSSNIDPCKSNMLDFIKYDTLIRATYKSMHQNIVWATGHMRCHATGGWYFIYMKYILPLQ